MERKHREACDACHNRKVRCASRGPGACSNCQSSGRVCVFSPTQEMGRPRKVGRKKDRTDVHAGQRKSGASDPWEEPCEGSVVQSWMIQNRPSSVDETCQTSQASAAERQSDLLTGHFASPISMVLPLPAFTPIPLMDAHSIHETQSNTHHTFESSLSEETGQNRGTPDLEDLIGEFAGQPSAFQPGPTLSPLQTNSSRSTSSGSTLDTYHHICRIIFDLRTESGAPSVSAAAACSSTEKTFSSVASLCDVLQSVLSSREDSNGDLCPPADESSSTFMLALTAISKVLDKYRFLCQLFSGSMKTPHETVSLSHEWLGIDMSISKSSPALPSSQPNTCRHLNDVLQLTTMDFHLAQLQRIFRHLQPQHSSQYVSVAEEGGANIQELRALLRSSMEALRGDAGVAVA